MCFPRSKNCFDEDFLQHVVVTVPIAVDTWEFSVSVFFAWLIMKPAAAALAN